MLHRGIDVSNWDNIDAIPYEIDFLIAKCTEGLTFRDWTFESYKDYAKDNGLLFGAYHFADLENANKEAEFFYENVKDSNAFPFLDFEIFSLSDDVVRSWCEEFIQRFYELSGIYCGLYVSQSLCQCFKGSWIAEKCKLWVAGYYTDEVIYDIPEHFSYDVAPWIMPFIWQFSGRYCINGTCFDGDLGFFERSDWDNCENGFSELEIHTACKVILGWYGNGNARKTALENEGWSYDRIQSIVNRMLGSV